MSKLKKVILQVLMIATIVAFVAQPAFAGLSSILMEEADNAGFELQEEVADQVASQIETEEDLNAVMDDIKGHVVGAQLTEAYLEEGITLDRATRDQVTDYIVETGDVEGARELIEQQLSADDSDGDEDDYYSSTSDDDSDRLSESTDDGGEVSDAGTEESAPTVTQEDADQTEQMLEEAAAGEDLSEQRASLVEMAEDELREQVRSQFAEVNELGNQVAQQARQDASEVRGQIETAQQAAADPEGLIDDVKEEAIDAGVDMAREEVISHVAEETSLDQEQAENIVGGMEHIASLEEEEGLDEKQEMSVSDWDEMEEELYESSYGQDIVISKDDVGDEIPDQYKESEKSFKKGADGVYRQDVEEHPETHIQIREFDDEYVIQKNKYHPDENPVKHALYDVGEQAVRKYGWKDGAEEVAEMATDRASGDDGDLELDEMIETVDIAVEEISDDLDAAGIETGQDRLEQAQDVLSGVESAQEAHDELGNLVEAAEERDIGGFTEASEGVLTEAGELADLAGQEEIAARIDERTEQLGQVNDFIGEAEDLEDIRQQGGDVTVGEAYELVEDVDQVEAMEERIKESDAYGYASELVEEGSISTEEELYSFDHESDFEFSASEGEITGGSEESSNMPEITEEVWSGEFGVEESVDMDYTDEIAGVDLDGNLEGALRAGGSGSMDAGLFEIEDVHGNHHDMLGVGAEGQVGAVAELTGNLDAEKQIAEIGDHDLSLIGEADGALQAGGEASGTGYAGLTESGLMAGGELEGFIGARAKGALSGGASLDGVGDITGSIDGNVGVGLGGRLAGDVQVGMDGISYDVGADAYLGIGGGIGTSGEISLDPEMQERIKGGIDEVQDMELSEAADTIRDRGSDLADGARDHGARDLGDALGDRADQARDAASDARDRVEDGIDSARDRASDARDRVRDGVDEARDRARDARDSARDRASDARDRTRDAADRAESRARDAGSSAKDAYCDNIGFGC